MENPSGCQSLQSDRQGRNSCSWLTSRQRGWCCLLHSHLGSDVQARKWLWWCCHSVPGPHNGDSVDLENETCQSWNGNILFPTGKSFCFFFFFFSSLLFLVLFFLLSSKLWKTELVSNLCLHGHLLSTRPCRMVTEPNSRSSTFQTTAQFAVLVPRRRV